MTQKKEAKVPLPLPRSHPDTTTGNSALECPQQGVLPDPQTYSVYKAKSQKGSCRFHNSSVFRPLGLRIGELAKVSGPSLTPPGPPLGLAAAVEAGTLPGFRLIPEGDI